MDRWSKEGIPFVLGHARALAAGRAAPASLRLPGAEAGAARLTAPSRSSGAPAGRTLSAPPHDQPPVPSPGDREEAGGQGEPSGSGEEHCPEPRGRKTLAVEVSRIDHSDQLGGEGALSSTCTAQTHAGQPFARRQSVPGSGQILALGILSEMQDLARFPQGPDCVSSCRLVQCATESGGKRLGTSGTQIATVPLRGAVAAAAVVVLRHPQPGQEYFPNLAHQHGKATALTGLAPKLARAGYDRLARAQALALTRFVPP